VRRFVLIGVVVVVGGLTTASSAGASGWAIQPTPNPTVPQGTLTAVTCTSAKACTAVGYAPDAAGTIVTLAERWDGAAWTIQPTPNPAGATTGALDGVSCSSMSACIAVGHYVDRAGTTGTLSEAWDGNAWTVQPTPNPVGATDSELHGVSCSTAVACTAVGSSSDSGGSALTLAERWNGSSWTIQTTPNPTGSDFMFRGVSCTTASACTAVGQYTAPGGAAAALAEVWDGTSWTTQSTPNTPGANDSLDSVSCMSQGACTAVGHSFGFFDTRVSLAERWDGTSWTIQTTPNPVGSSFVYLRGVSCTTPSACTAVGFYTNSAGLQVTLAEVWDGTDWTIQSTPNPAGPSFVGLFGVSCSAPSACTAAGESQDSSAAQLALAERWDGSSWTIVDTPNPAGADPLGTELARVSCSTVSRCVSVGISSTELLAESRNGSTWTIQDTPSPAGAQRSLLVGVSCTSPPACVAVGSYVDSAGARHTLAAGWDGDNWSLQPVPLPAGARSGSLFGVSCTSPMACIAVGNYVNGAGTTVTLVEGWDGTSWSVVQSPNPAGARDSELGGVSCSTAAACTAVGFYLDSTGAFLPLVETQSGSGWVVQAAPLPAGASSRAFLVAVSCSAATACTAMGSYTNSQTFTSAGLAERWDGSNWTVQPTASPVTGANVSVSGVSCASSTSCIAVGDYTDSASHQFTLAEAWNGTSWRVQPSPNPPGALSSTLSGVSCATTTNCTAVGSSFGASPNGGDAPSVSLAEQYNASMARAPTSLTAAPQLVIFPPPFGVGLGKVSATLTSGGSPVAGRTITFAVSGIPLCRSVTGANGTATCNVSFLGELIVLFVGGYSAAFAGDSKYLSSSATTPWIELGQFGLARQASLGAHRRASIVGGTLTRGRVRYAVLVRRSRHCVIGLAFKALRRMRPGRYTLTLKLNRGTQVRRTVALK
jgi:hypothetical protein